MHCEQEISSSLSSPSVRGAAGSTSAAMSEWERFVPVVACIVVCVSHQRIAIYTAQSSHSRAHARTNFSVIFSPRLSRSNE